jgi:glycosyltransferase involved in cell wall biosynthesis
MNVLVVALQLPFPPRSGVNMRVYQLMRQIAARHDVTLLTYARPDQRADVADLRKEFPVHVVERTPPAQIARRAAQLRSIASARPFSAAEAHTAAMEQALHALCESQVFDIVQVEGALLCEIPMPDGPRVVLDEHNIDYEVFQRMCESERSRLRRIFHRIECRRFRHFERNAWTRIHGCAVTSEREEPIVHEAAPSTPTAAVPNGVDLGYFAPSSSPAQPRTLVFNGTLDYRPNVDAAYHLVDDIWPLVRERCPDAELTIVGRGSESELRRLRRDGVVATGEVPDLRPYLQRAAVVGVPVRMGGGTRLKVVEGLAMGKAMVSTTLGCEGVTVRDGTHLVVADGAQAFAAAVVELFADPGRGQALGAAGRRLIEDEYSWDFAGDRLETLYQTVAVGAEGTPAGAFNTIGEPVTATASS